MRGLKHLICGGALAALVGSACGAPEEAASPPPPREVEVLTLAPSEVRETGEYLGSLLSRESATVLSQASGYVRRIHVRPGQTVAMGDPILDIDAREEAATLESAAADRQSALANLELARQSKTRAEALFREGLAAAEEVERTRADVAAAEARHRATQAEVAQRQVQLQYNVVRAPVPGTIGDVLVRVGDYVSTSTELTTIAQANALELSVSVPAERARDVHVGTPIEIIDAQGRMLVASNVFYIAPEADPRTQLVPLKATFANDAGLRPSELVRTRVVYTTQPAIQVPALAVTRQSGQAFAFVVDQQKGQTVVARRPVVLGTLGEEAYVVKQGLVAGDRVAVSSLQMLRDGAPIRPVERPKPQTSVSQANTPTSTNEEN